LIHLSSHWKARDVMTDLHWELGTTFAHYGRPGLYMLGYDQDCDEGWTGQPFLPAIAQDFRIPAGGG
jgi:hypothetical protein